MKHIKDSIRVTAKQHEDTRYEDNNVMSVNGYVHSLHGGQRPGPSARNSFKM